MYEGISQISPIYVRVARTLGATDGEIFRKVIIPLAVPHMLTALACRARRRLGDAGRFRADRRPAGARRADPERRLVLPARHHLCRHHLHRLRRPVHGHGAARDRAPLRELAGAHRMNVRQGAHCLQERLGALPDAGRRPNAGGRRRHLRHPRPRVRLGDRPVRLRQDHDDEHRRGLHAAVGRQRHAGRQADQRPRPGSRRHLPGVRRLSLADGEGQHRLRAQPARQPHRRGRARGHLRTLHAPDGPCRFRRRLAAHAVGRHAPAPRPGPRLRRQAASSC